VDKNRWIKVSEKQRSLAALHNYAETTRYEGLRMASWLKRPESAVELLPPEMRSKFHVELWEQLEIDLKYEGYIARQNIAIDRLRADEGKRIPTNLDYSLIHGLRAETRQKLSAVKPETLGQASRISGITPADLALLSVVMQKPLRPA